MKVVTTIHALSVEIQAAKQAQKSIGLVPTMGYLHEGHLTLAKTARAENDLVVMSIFVNPTQFGPDEDFESYPRDLPRDTALAESAGVDIIFAPSVEEMYPSNGGIRIHAGEQATILCGASRPGHFDGVLQVVAKLFHLAQPTRAYFGQKDAQQVAIIATMVRDFNFPLDMRVVPIVREADGLAKSSRNVYLSEAERLEAPAINEALQLARDSFLANRDATNALAKAKAHIAARTHGEIDYIELLAYPDLTPVFAETEQVLLAAAVYIGKTRLIDNCIFNVKEGL
ncbi:pantoate--beta-alanine ligase [Lysinibacillus sphaericus]|uniref:pantoate--beta-alanine ligase n=1 Tax=Lysinibacillus sphaericus TaxID=1421 RepID=UPI0018CE4608|nr:pantoate--beta-alanine ligase [Lysinibacillus sphaericus]MBG9452790.1 pantoate--beta-alanine ligase [Lysinibacillus sphaericus]MBG9478884.1 pantoate--beta-alanine ligase [Lysinibacillus sphaericus]MBG9592153.1 pantoate--beta-alanine ligase [Lysinibacillus sphaericus]